VKGPVLAAVKRVTSAASVHFVGGHPLAGSHQTGVDAADPRLFEGSTVVLVPGSRAGLRPLKTLWRAVERGRSFCPAQDHDNTVALISHLPHAMAHALVHVLARRQDRRRLIPLLAGSFRDVTRVASSDPEQWAQILRANIGPLRHAVRDFSRELRRLEKTIPTSRLAAHLKKSQMFRRPLFHGR